MTNDEAVEQARICYHDALIELLRVLVKLDPHRDSAIYHEAMKYLGVI
jgi:hypothetical protein